MVSRWEGPLDADAAVNRRRRELAGRVARSGDEHPLRLLVHQRAALGLSRRRRAVGHGVRHAARCEIRMRRTAGAHRVARAGAAGGGEAARGWWRRSLVQGLPLVKPPYGRSRRSISTRAIVWQIAHGDTPDNVRNHPALKGLTSRGPAARPHRHAGDQDAADRRRGGFFTTPSGQRGAMLRAYDKATGQEVGAVYMPAPQTGSPMTYMLNGRQYPPSA